MSPHAVLCKLLIAPVLALLAICALAPAPPLPASLTALHGPRL